MQIAGKLEQSWQVNIMNKEFMLKSIQKAFNEMGLHLWLSYGTCLGIVRDGALIPWDTDLDLGCIDTLNDKLVNDLTSCFGNKGFLVIWDKDQNMEDSLTLMMVRDVIINYKMKAYDSCEYNAVFHNISASITFHILKGEYIKTTDGIVFPVELFKDLKHIEFQGDKYLVPNPPEEYLRIAYGKDWRIPKRTGWEKDWQNQ